MRRIFVGIALAALMVTSSLPIASASQTGVSYSSGPAETTMFVHLGEVGGSPINTQEPPAHHTRSSDYGLVQHSQGCVDNPGGSLLSEPHHTWYAYGYAGIVPYMESQNNGHGLMGIGYDVHLQSDSPVEFHWSIASQIESGETGANQAPSVVPNVVVRATIREGQQLSVAHSAYNTGNIIAQGQSDPITLAGPLTQDHPQVSHTTVGDQYVYDFAFNLDLESTTIRESEGYNLRVDIFLDNPACNDVHAGEYVMPDLIRQHTSVGHRPYFVWQVVNPLAFHGLHSSVIGDDLVVNAVLNSAWGNYDLSGDPLDDNRLSTMTLLGPDGAQVPLTPTDFGGYIGSYGHQAFARDSIATTWAWENGLADAKDGTYTLNLTVVNDQNKATMTIIQGFQIGDGKLGDFAACATSVCQASDFSSPSKDSPGIGLVLLIGALAIIARR